MKHIILVFSVLLFSISNINAQKDEAETELKYIKNTDESRTLTYTVKYTDTASKKSVEAVNIPVTFAIGPNKQNLVTIKTNSFGIARHTILANEKLPTKAGKYSFFATINENDKLETKSDSVSLQDIFLDMSLELKDSVKTIVFSAYEMDSKGNKQYVKTDLVFYVPRTFSKLKIAEASTSEDGNGEVEFPENIPGDSLGNLTVIGRVEENEIYATVEKSQVIAWGEPTNYHVSKFHRALWTTIAPYWMIVTLTILLLGVWGHYMYVIYKIFRINKEIE